MEDLIKLLLQITLEIKHIKESLKLLNKSRYDNLKEAWVDSLDVMNMLHVSRRTIRTLRNKGQLPFTRIGNKIYFKLSDVERILEFHNKYKLNNHEKGTK